MPQAQHHLTEGQHHFERSENIVSHFAAQMNEVALRANEDAASRKRCDVRINDVALRANGTEHLSHIGATILHPNTKVLDFQGLLCF